VGHIYLYILTYFDTICRRLDYETRSTYRFTVVASRDTGRTPPTVQLLDEADVEINVTDIEDCKAEFEKSVYRATIPADSPVGYQVEPVLYNLILQPFLLGLALFVLLR
jgi:hypothetical protein